MSNVPHDEIGRVGVPAHYAGEREAIDVIRDELGDVGFIAYCTGAAMKYRRRAGSKPGESAEKDIAKASWYEQMVEHVRGVAEDPRATRPGFEPYKRPLQFFDKLAFINAPKIEHVEFSRRFDIDAVDVWVRAAGHNRKVGTVPFRDLARVPKDKPFLIDCAQAFDYAYGGDAPFEQEVPKDYGLTAYQLAAAETASYPTAFKDAGPHLYEAVNLPIYPALGLVGEAGEFAEVVKKGWRDGRFDRSRAIAELGDVLWYVAMCARDIGIDLSDVARENILKLASRQIRGVIHGSGDGR